MKILILTSAYNSAIGGIEKQTDNLISEFLKKGHEVKLICTKSLPQHSLQYGDTLIKAYLQPNLVLTLKLFFWCSTLYMPNISLKGWYFLFFRPFKSWVISHNDYYLAHSYIGIKTIAKRLLLKFASNNISVSNDVAKTLANNSHVIYNSFDNRIFTIDEQIDRIYDIVFLGRLVSQKGCDLLIKAAKNLRNPVTINIVGDGPERANLENLVEKFKLENSIKFWGIMEGRQLADFLNQNKIMVITPRTHEGFGMVALEGLACGCKIIAANAGGLAEAVRHFGKTFTMGSVEELSELIASELEVDYEYPTKNYPDLDAYLKSHHIECVADKYLALFQ